MSVVAVPVERLGFGRALAAVATAFVIAQLAGKVIVDVMAPGVNFGASLAQVAPALLARSVVPSMLASELALLAVALATPLIAALPLRAALGLEHGAPVSVFAAAAVGTILLGPLGDTLMSALSAHFPSLGMGTVDALRGIAQKLPLALLWPAFALAPGLAEELLFRGVLQRSVAPGVFAVGLSGVGFALFHVDPVHVAGVLPLGLFLAWVGQRASTRVTVLAHVLNNSFALLAIKSEALDVGYGTERDLPPLWLAGSLVGVAICAWVVARGTEPTRVKPVG